jgi:hypothetical protein
VYARVSIAVRVSVYLVQRNGELDHTQGRAQVATGLRHSVDQVRPDLAAQLPQLLVVEVLHVHRVRDSVQQRRGWPCGLPAIDVV